MTLWDLFTGHFTWTQLFSALAPLAIVGFSAFFAGYWRGRNAEVRTWEGRVARLEERQIAGRTE